MVLSVSAIRDVIFNSAPERESRLPPRPRTAIVIAVLGILVVSLVWFLTAVSIHAFGGNSDGATVVLEGNSLIHGNLTLSGWDLSLDSFWTVDAPIYALAVLVAGVNHLLLNVIPAVIAVAVILVGTAAAARGHRGFARLLAAGGVVVFLGLPNPTLAFFLLQGPWHIGTVLWCLLAFVLLDRTEITWRWVLAVLFLAAGMLGDLQTVFLGIAPVFTAGLVAMGRCRRLRPGLSTTLAAPAALLAAGLIRGIGDALGTFHIATSFLRAPNSQIPKNAELIGSWGLGLIGVGRIPLGSGASVGSAQLSGGSAIVRDLHVIVALMLLGAVVLGLAAMARSLLKGRQHELPSAGSSWRIEDLLLLAFFADLGLFVYLNPTNDGDGARYLTAGLIFAAILTGCILGRLAERPMRRAREFVGVITLIALAVCSLGVAQNFVGAEAKAPAADLGHFLLSHHLTSGVGDYWSSSLTTLETNGAVVVRPVIWNRKHILVRYGRQSDVAWYREKTFSFFVYDTARPWRRVDAAPAIATFGPPARTYDVGTYRVMTWTTPLQVSSIGFTRT